MVAEMESLLNTVSRIILAVAVLFSLLVVTRYSERRDLFAPVRKRLLLGVPWGTLTVVFLVYGVFVVFQGGNRWSGPVVVGFRSWSLWYPQGMFFSSFSHASRSHLIGNLLGTVAFAPVAEYGWGHYPQKRGSQSFSGWRRNPFVRIGLFVVAVWLLGIAGAVLVPGAVIGFSGVVFAFAGFGLVVRPLTTTLAILGLEVLSLLRQAVLDPFSVAVARPEVVSPDWANTAIQGHLFGLLVGILLGAALVQSRSERPSLTRIWFGTLVFAITRSLHALYWYQGADEFLFFRGIGAAGVLVLASVVALTVLSWDRPVLQDDLSPGATAAGFLVALLCALAVVGIAYNLMPVTPGAASETGIDVQDYTVTYAEAAENQYIAALQIPGVRDSLSVNMSGVIITSDRRNVWSLDTSATRLKQNGRSYVVVGGPAWREELFINRTEWQVVGRNTTYKVYGRRVNTDRSNRTLLFSSGPAVSRTVLNGTHVGIRPANGSYELLLTENGTTRARTTMPSHNETVQLRGITFTRKNKSLIAIHERTRLIIATYRTGGRLKRFS